MQQVQDPLRNISPGTAPLVTVSLMAHEGDAKYLPRSVGSLKAQTLPPTEMEVIVTFDGEPSDQAMAYITDAAAGAKFPVRLFYETEKSGYYTAPRNRTMPTLRGLYVVHMDADNEFLPEHLQTLLTAIRTPDDESGWAHFAYTRRRYVRDDDAKVGLPEGPSPLREWNADNVAALRRGPLKNFVDTGDFIVGRSVLYELAERTGFVWNSELRRFGDWDLVKRMAECGFRGKAVNAITHTYHWHGGNVSTANMSEFVAIPQDIYERLKEEGKVKA